MRITTGRVQGGLVDLREAELPEGALVTIISRNEGETFELGPAEEAELVAALEAVDRGETVDDSRLREWLRLD